MKNKHRTEMFEAKWQVDHLMQKARQLEEKVLDYKKKVDPDAIAGSSSKLDEYDTKQNSHRIRALLLEMEKQSKDHIHEVNRVHEHYQIYVTRSQELEQKCKALQRDTDNAIQSERAVRRELKRLQL